MSVGFFLGFLSRGPSARAELELVRRALSVARLPDYDESRSWKAVRKRYETLHKESRSSLDHTGSNSLKALGRLSARVDGLVERPLAELSVCSELRFIPGRFLALGARLKPTT